MELEKKRTMESSGPTPNDAMNDHQATTGLSLDDLIAIDKDPATAGTIDDGCSSSNSASPASITIRLRDGTDVVLSPLLRKASNMLQAAFSSTTASDDTTRLSHSWIANSTIYSYILSYLEHYKDELDSQEFKSVPAHPPPFRTTDWLTEWKHNEWEARWMQSMYDTHPHELPNLVMAVHFLEIPKLNHLLSGFLAMLVKTGKYGVVNSLLV